MTDPTQPPNIPPNAISIDRFRVPYMDRLVEEGPVQNVRGHVVEVRRKGFSDTVRGVSVGAVPEGLVLFTYPEGTLTLVPWEKVEAIYPGEVQPETVESAWLHGVHVLCNRDGVVTTQDGRTVRPHAFLISTDDGGFELDHQGDPIAMISLGDADLYDNG